MERNPYDPGHAIAPAGDEPLDDRRAIRPEYEERHSRFEGPGPVYSPEEAEETGENGRAGEDAVRDAPVAPEGRAADTAQDSRDVDVDIDIDMDQRWRDIKAAFVDDPRGSVEQADALVEEAVSAVDDRRRSLADRWRDPDTKDTEELRLALREYRTLLTRLTGK
ncbi:hypothetical protein IMZ11_32460 [Microtetraspora sp. AC03309]|uniref:hypothetical protein n=1 Tax=Microtetraspora sp. AC03309 TaxID=2779376 RepID=UPI001E41D430|nr:hypothetical protein [Microtetraspora sp. AC03309]MCC5580342.1 hypothetical protein [Microtetraspora sp. AC03309]